MHPLDESTRLTRLDDLRFQAELDARYWGHVAAHGGYLAALLLRALILQVDDAARAPRSLTVHFLRAPEVGPAEVHVEPLRTGGKISCLTARIVQDGSPTTFAVAAFGSAFDGDGFQHATAPELPPPEACPRITPSRVAIDHRFEHRVGLGHGPFAGAERARVGGYSRLDEPRTFDALSAVLICDGWWPALFSRYRHRGEASGCPTVDLTVHFRSSFPVPGMGPSDYVLVDLCTDTLREGYLDERCRIWSRHGQLLAESVQHAVRLRPKG